MIGAIALATLMFLPAAAMAAMPYPRPNSAASARVPGLRRHSPTPLHGALTPAQQLALQLAIGDEYGGRTIPAPVIKILSDPRVEPITAYIVWQAARKPLDQWTLKQLQDVTATLPTLAETGIPIGEIQELYKFLDLDPGDIFNPQLGQDWQERSTRFDPNSTAAVAAISSVDCQTDPSVMTVGTFRACNAGGQ